jgi:hypothetical protein
MRLFTHVYQLGWCLTCQTPRYDCEWDDSLHPRDDAGRFTESDGGSAAPDEGVQRAIDAVRDKRSTALSRDQLREFLDYAAADKSPLPLDLAKVHVFGGDIFTGGKVPRELMPQVPRDLHQDFLADLMRDGVTVTSEVVAPTALRPSQSQLDARNIGENLQKYDPAKRVRAIFVSKDNYVLDGHHRWATLALAEMLKGYDVKVPVIRIGLNRDAALFAMHDFGQEFGVARNKHGDSNQRKIAASMWYEPFYEDDPEVFSL